MKEQLPITETAMTKPKVNPWIIGIAVSLAAFMEVLDTSITNVALPYIAGNLGASNDESTWVLTTYLVSNVIVLPISCFLVSWLGRKRFFSTCIVFFTIRFMRNMGQSVGTLAVTTLIARRSQYHQSVLAEYTQSPRFNAVVAGLATRLTRVGLSPYYAHQQAVARMYAMLTEQAQAISYVEVYWLPAGVSVLVFFLSFLLAKNEPGTGGEVSMH